MRIAYAIVPVSIVALLLIAVVWTSSEPDRINATAGLAVAAGTLILSIVTYFGIRSSQTQARDAQHASARPVLVPVAMIQRAGLWDAAYQDLVVNNVGTGVALNVLGVILPPPMKRKGLPPQLSMQSSIPVAPGETTEVHFQQGGTMFTGEHRIGPVQMGVPAELAPEEGFPSPYNRRYRADARLTLTYVDVFHRKHAAIYDLDTMDHWTSVAILDDIQFDIDDMDAANAPVPPASPPRLPGD